MIGQAQDADSIRDRLRRRPGGQELCPTRTFSFHRHNRVAPGHAKTVQCIMQTTARPWKQ